jgi:DNA-binding helix-hairpin-helix protein with protein kinase domain
MSGVSVSWVRPDQLGDYTAHRLGDGGQGTVYGVPSPPGRLAGEYLAYKEYAQGIAYDADVLHDMVCFRLQLADGERTFLDERLAWPRAMVYTGTPPTLLPPSRNTGTRVRGFLMPRVTDTYELHSPLFPKPKQQALEFLLNDDAYASRIGLVVDDTQRLALLLDLARILERLHRNAVVVGDLSPKNVLFSLSGKPRCVLIDCDSMRYRNKDVLPQVDTPDWEVPEAQKATIGSDSWKFGLIATRLFNRQQDGTDLGPLRVVSTELAGLATRARQQDPRRRPAPSDWVRPLELAHHRLQRPRAAASTPNSANSANTARSTATTALRCSRSRMRARSRRRARR